MEDKDMTEPIKFIREIQSLGQSMKDEANRQHIEAEST